MRLILEKESTVQDLHSSSPIRASPRHLNIQIHLERPDSQRPSLCFILKSKPLLVHEKTFHREPISLQSTLPCLASIPLACLSAGKKEIAKENRIKLYGTF